MITRCSFFFCVVNALAAGLCCLWIAGCSGAGWNSWHSAQGWVADDYFQDPDVVLLCETIQANDLAAINTTIEAGADVNATGKGNMTPLLWAFPDNKVERFKLLLEQGADPNVRIESDFGVGGAIHAGQSVTGLAAGTQFEKHFYLVMEHGGDAKFIDTHYGESLLHAVIKSRAADKERRIQLLIDRNVDLNHLSDLDVTPLMCAINRGQYNIALMLLHAGADPLVYQKRSNQKAVHFLARELQLSRGRTTANRSKLEEIAEILEEHGESLSDARDDLERWMERGRVHPPAKVKELREKEIAERLEREK